MSAMLMAAAMTATRIAPQRPKWMVRKAAAKTSTVYPRYEPKVKKSPWAKLISFSTPYTMV